MSESAHSPKNATLIGLLAPLCWGMSVGLIRSVTEQFEFAAGMALLTWTAVIILFFILGLPDLKKFPKKFLFLGIPSANVYTVFFGLSMYLSDGGRQTVEVGMVNYLWPCLTVLFASLFNGQKARWWLWPGVIVSFIGIMLVLGGEQGIDLAGIAGRFRHNPWSYLFALAGAVMWGAYSNFTRAWSNGQNPTLIVFIIDAAIFTALWACGYGSISGVSFNGWLSMVLGALAMAVPCAAWTYGVSKGNITILAIASYFTPVLSCVFASLWIGASLTASFWLGVAVIVAGSLLCWSSTVLYC